MSKQKRPEGIIGEWYTLTTDFEGSKKTSDREAGYTWKCEEVDCDGSPLLDGVWISSREGYRLATHEEIERAKSEQKPSKEAREFWERAFCALFVDSSLSVKNCAELADEAIPEWQKRFE